MGVRRASSHPCGRDDGSQQPSSRATATWRQHPLRRRWWCDVHRRIIRAAVLMRANKTLDIILKKTRQEDIPITKDQALNERMYGDLQGLNKDDTRAKYGDEQVHIWRRPYDVQPPGGESLKDTADRVLPYFDKEIAPKIKAGEKLIIAAHGNSLRALIMQLDKLSREEILNVEIPTGVPKVYELDENLNVRSSEFLR